MEETQSTDNFLALSPRAGRRLGIWEKETQASWPRHHPLASLGNYGTSRTRDLAQTPQLLASSGHLWFGVVMVLELEILSNYFLWPSYHIRDAYTSHLLPQVFLSPPPTVPWLAWWKEQKKQDFTELQTLTYKTSKGMRVFIIDITKHTTAI